MRRIAAVVASVAVLSCGDARQPPTAPTPPASTYVVSGVVRDDKGAPVAGADVYAGCLACKSGPGFSATTSASGTYSGNLPAGTFGILVRKPGFLVLTIYDLVVAGNTTRDITLTPGVRVSGQTFEQGVGALTGVLIEAIAGPSAGASTKTSPPGVPNAYGLTLLPGEHRIRASKEGYDSVERTVHAAADVHGVDFTLKWTYGSCLQSVTPVLFGGYRSAGGEEAVTVNASPGRAWTAVPDQEWMTVASPSPQTGPGRLVFRILPHPAGAVEPRNGAIMIRCSASEGQNVWVTQHPDCQAQLTPHADTPSVFPASGGVGRLRITTGVPGCRWQSSSMVDWIYSVGVNSWNGSFDSVSFAVKENTTGATRTGAFIAGEKAWSVTQR